MSSPQGWGKAPSASEPNRIWEKPRRSSLEPFPHGTRVSRGRSFSQPILPEGTGNSGITPGGEVASSSLPEKAFQEKTEQGTLTCSTFELPLRVAGEDRTRTGNHALIRRSNPDLTAWKIGARRRNRTGLVRLTGSARRCLRLTGKLVAAPGNAPGLGANLARFRL